MLNEVKSLLNGNEDLAAQTQYSWLIVILYLTLIVNDRNWSFSFFLSFKLSTDEAKICYGTGSCQIILIYKIIAMSDQNVQYSNRLSWRF